MGDPHAAAEAAIQEASQTQKALRKNKTTQVTASDERAILKGTTLAWFRKHRRELAAVLSAEALEPVDGVYQTVLEATERRTLRSKYVKCLERAKASLVQLRSEIAVADAATPLESDKAADFSPLVSDAAMRRVLNGRWRETLLCLNAGAHLAATVMMGGLLEALLLARVNHLSDKRPVFTAAKTPKDRSGKVLPLKEWTLKHYIDVAHELRWISQSAKDVGRVLRDYRNYIHPHKELSHGIELVEHDSRIFWEVAKSISTQIIASV